MLEKITYISKSATLHFRNLAHQTNPSPQLSVSNFFEILFALKQLVFLLELFEPFDDLVGRKFVPKIAHGARRNGIHLNNDL